MQAQEQMNEFDKFTGVKKVATKLGEEYLVVTLNEMPFRLTEEDAFDLMMKINNLLDYEELTEEDLKTV